MALKIKAKYVNGTLNPLEPLELKEGTVVTLAIEENVEPKVHSALQIADRIREAAPPGTWDNTPTDGAKNYRHYLYGHPKEEE